MSEPLRPCPFCSGNPVKITLEEKHWLTPAARQVVRCSSCGASVPQTNTVSAEQNWNRRATVPLQQAALAEVGMAVRQAVDQAIARLSAHGRM